MQARAPKRDTNAPAAAEGRHHLPAARRPPVRSRSAEHGLLARCMQADAASEAAWEAGVAPGWEDKCVGKTTLPSEGILDLDVFESPEELLTLGSAALKDALQKMARAPRRRGAADPGAGAVRGPRLSLAPIAGAQSGRHRRAARGAAVLGAGASSGQGGPQAVRLRHRASRQRGGGGQARCGWARAVGPGGALRPHAGGAGGRGGRDEGQHGEEGDAEPGGAAGKRSTFAAALLLDLRRL